MKLTFAKIVACTIYNEKKMKRIRAKNVNNYNNNMYLIKK